MSELDDKPRILIVDDLPGNIKMLMASLREDYKISIAMNGESALEFAMAKHPDLILMDVVMPGMDGYEVCRRLQLDATTQDIPIIFVTGKSDETDEAFGMSLGAVDFIAKPFSVPIVRARVKTHLALKQAREQIRTLNAEMGQLKDDLASLRLTGKSA